jgi:type IV pilus assembly protein PilY1
LQQQSIIAAVTSGNFNLRATSDNTVNYPTQKGWYMDLLEPSATISNGERVVSAPLLRNGRIIFVTLIPIPPLSTIDICGTGSGVTSWLMELDGVTGQRLPATAGGTPWDINGDGVINASDLITVTIDGQSVKVAPSGKQSTVGGVKTPGVISNGQLEYKYTSGTQEAELEVTTENSGGSSASTGIRKSWRQLFQ